MYASVKEPPLLYDTPKDQPLINFGAEGAYDNREGQVYDNKGTYCKVKNYIYNFCTVFIGGREGGMEFSTTFNNISVISFMVSFIGGGNWSTRRKPQTCRNSLTNFIT